jgi:type IV pilus assembly protein PilQ
VPLLGDIPFLGNLFKNKQRISNRTELLIFITPKIVTDRSAAR